MEFDQVHAFLAIRRRGTFTAAAVDLHLSQPALSRRMALLERELGAPLFERVPAGVVLTDAGRVFLPHAEAMIAAQLDATAAVTEVLGGRQGVVTLALVGTLASRQLGATLHEFRAARPGVDLQLRTALSAQVSDLVRRGEATLGLRYESDPNLDSQQLYAEQLVPICSASHPLAQAPLVPEETLARERWLTFPPGRGETREAYSIALDEHLTRSGLARAEVVPIDSLTAQKRLVEAGFGLAFVPASSVEEELQAGSLRVLRLAKTGPTIPVVLVRRNGGFQSPATRALAEALRSQTRAHDEHQAGDAQ